MYKDNISDSAYIMKKDEMYNINCQTVTKVLSGWNSLKHKASAKPIVTYDRCCEKPFRKNAFVRPQHLTIA